MTRIIVVLFLGLSVLTKDLNREELPTVYYINDTWTLSKQVVAMEMYGFWRVQSGVGVRGWRPDFKGLITAFSSFL